MVIVILTRTAKSVSRLLAIKRCTRKYYITESHRNVSQVNIAQSNIVDNIFIPHFNAINRPRWRIFVRGTKSPMAHCARLQCGNYNRSQYARLRYVFSLSYFLVLNWIRRALKFSFLLILPVRTALIAREIARDKYNDTIKVRSLVKT